jgi:DNA-binding XRE family transcriptional regulator
MKKPHIDTVSMTFTGPAVMMAPALEAMRTLGFTEAADHASRQMSAGSIPWRQTSYFKEIEENLSAVHLSGARYREGLTQAALAERTGIPRRHISEMENGRRPIGKINSRKLAAALNIDPRRLLSM